jgi:predicted small lipoprotein YifL
VIAAFVALALSGCGRKGPLDLPPSAAAPPNSATPSGETTQQSLMTPFGAPTETHPPPPTGRKRKLPIDALID